MRVMLALVAMLGFAAQPTMAAAPVDKGAQEVATGYDFLKQQKYQEARTAFEAGLQLNPANAMAHFYLGDACRGLKAWACAEAHYETSLELDAQSPVAGLAKQRGRKAKVWRLLEDGKQAINEPKALPEKVAQAKDTLDIANKLGLDDEQQAFYQLLQEKIQQRHKQNHAKAASAETQEMPMALVPAGEFIMGSPGGAADEQPVHRVYVDAFFMDKYEVSVGQYAKFLEDTSLEAPPDWDIMNQPQHQKRPVVNIDWADAVMYCKWAGKRLPTEAEWEKAARGTDGRIYPWGNEFPTRLHANFGKTEWNNHAALVPVGKLEDGKSPYGIYDMAGNAWEWVNDWYDANYYKSSPSQNPSGPSSAELKVLRGGSWSDTPDDLRSANPHIYEPAIRYHNVGFRCVKTP
jgi:formylglycine-generating enzyme required for sulfatase activity